MGFSFNRQGILPRRSSAPTTAPVGVLALSDIDLAVEVEAGSATPVALVDTVAISSSSVGRLANPVATVSAWSNAEDWLTLTVTPLVDRWVLSAVVDPSGLSAGTEIATVSVADANASNSPQTLTITATVVAPAPAIGLAPTSLAFSVVDETVGTAQTVIISNAGTGTLADPTVGTVTGAGAPYLSTVEITGSGPWTLTVTPDATGGTPGTYAASIPILSTGATNTPLALPVTITVTAAAQAFLSATISLQDANTTVGGSNPAPQSTALRSTTSIPLAGPVIDSITYTGASSGWAEGASITSNVLTVPPDTSGIATDGFSFATVRASDANAPNTIDFTVALRVGTASAPPVIAVAPSAVSRTAITGTDGVAFPVTITNGGTGGLAALGTVTAAFTTAITWGAVSYTAATGVALISFPSASLSAGTQSATLRITASAATNSPVDIPVQLVVQNPSGATYQPPAYDLPSFASWDSGTDETTGQPFTPADLADYTGTVRDVATQAQLQSAFNNCVDTDIIRITAPFTLTSTVTFPDRAFSGIGVLMIDAATYATISVLTRRVVAADFAGANTITDIALNGSTIGSSGIQAARGASRLRMVGVHIRNGYNFQSTFGKFAIIGWYPAQAPTSTTHECSRLHVDRCYLENPWTPGSDYFCTRGIQLGGTENIVEKSRIEGFVNGTAQDSQAIWVPTNSSGKNLIEDNFLEGAAENILIGGTSGLMGAGVSYASDILIRRNHLFKRTDWFTEGVRPWNASGSPIARQLKNLGEQKSGSRVMWEANVFENFDGTLSGVYNPTGGQAYDWTIAGKPQTSSDLGRVVCQHIHLRNSLFIGGAGKVNIANAVSDKGLSYVDSTKYVDLHNLWWTQTRAGQVTENRLLISGGSGTLRRLEGLRLSNITADCGNNFLLFSGLSNGAYPNFSCTDCVASGNLAFWGVSAQGSTNGDTSLNNNCGAGLWTFEGNVAWGSNQSSRPKWSGTFVAANNLQTSSQPTLDADGTLTGPANAMTAGVGGGRPGVDGAHLAVMIAGVV